MTKLSRAKRDKLAKKSWDAVVEYANTLGIEVVLEKNNGSYYCPEEMCAFINNKHSHVERLNTLLHEMGHALIFLDSEEQLNRFPKGYQTSYLKKANLGMRTDIIREEIAAWDAGQQIPGNIGCWFDPDSYTSSRNKALRTWFRWALVEHEKPHANRKEESKVE